MDSDSRTAAQNGSGLILFVSFFAPLYELLPVNNFGGGISALCRWGVPYPYGTVGTLVQA